MTMRIALSYHADDHGYAAYAEALQRRADALGLRIQTFWLGGSTADAGVEGLRTADAVLLTGGADVEPQRYGYTDVGGLCSTQPERDALELRVLEAVEASPLPALAVCRGAQLLNVFHGGTLIPDLGDRNATHKSGEGERRTHDVSIVEGTRLRHFAGVAEGVVNSSHHQAVDRLARGFHVAARSPDGVVEAFEREAAGGAFLMAVQWHPESMPPGLPLADRILDAFLRAAAS